MSRKGSCSGNKLMLGYKVCLHCLYGRFSLDKTVDKKTDFTVQPFLPCLLLKHGPLAPRQSSILEADQGMLCLQQSGRRTASSVGFIFSFRIEKRQCIQETHRSEPISNSSFGVMRKTNQNHFSVTLSKSIQLIALSINAK